MITKFASAERSSLNEMKEQLKDIMSASYLKDLMQALPNIAAILNENRQIVFANDALLQMLGSDCLDLFIGKRPGEVLSCIHSNELPGGCGTSESCKMCGAVNTILKSRQNNEKTVDECRVSSMQEGKVVSYDFQIVAAPIQINEVSYTLLTINDISSEKRKRMLERIFFHDILNASSNISGVVNLLKSTNDIKEIRKFIDIAGDATNQLNEEIIMQRELLAAENNELVVNMVFIKTKLVLNLAIHSIINHEIAAEKAILQSERTEDFIIYTDKVLIIRVLVNMLKNALEATGKDSVVQIGCIKNDNTCIFWVHNNEFISKEIQLQIFQRSFSTKGQGRGLGTYSIKILIENYLKGKTWFTSTEDQGTFFYISLPM